MNNEQDERHSKEMAEYEATGTLIAAAPELLEALEMLMPAIDDYINYKHNGDPWIEDARAMGEMDLNEMQKDGRLDKIRAAIAKATNQTT